MAASAGGKAALALWVDIDPADDSAFEHWHKTFWENLAITIQLHSIKRVVGQVLRENYKMLELTKRLGFKREGGRAGEPDIRIVKPTASL